MTRKDDNDRLVEGTLPFDIEEDCEVVHPEPPPFKLALRLVKPDDPPPVAGTAAPSDILAETALLAILLWHGAFSPGTLTVASVADTLDEPRLFYSAAHQRIFEAMLELNKRSTPADPVAVHSELARRGVDREAGGRNYLDQLVRSVTVASDKKLKGYAETIRAMWIRRELIAASDRLRQLALTGAPSSLELVEQAQQTVNEVAKHASVSSTVVRLSKTIGQAVRDIMHGKFEAIPTGFRDLDDALDGGLVAKETLVIAALTSVGKTALATQIALNIADDPKRAVLYITLEMDPKTLTSRCLAAHARVEMSKIRRHAVNSDDTSRMLDCGTAFGFRQIHFAASRQQTIMSIHALAYQLCARLAVEGEGVRLVEIIIDHVGLVKPSPLTMKAPREQQVAETSRGLAWLATEFNCHVTALAQIRRDADKGRDGKPGVPGIASIRESGALGQDADNVLILHREFDERGMPIPDQPATLLLAKARNGRKGAIKLKCEMQYVTFSDWTEGWA